MHQCFMRSLPSAKQWQPTKRKAYMLGNIALPYTAKLKQGRNRKKENISYEHFNSTESEITALNTSIPNLRVQATDSPKISHNLCAPGVQHISRNELLSRCKVSPCHGRKKLDLPKWPLPTEALHVLCIRLLILFGRSETSSKVWSALSPVPNSFARS